MQEKGNGNENNFKELTFVSLTANKYTCRCTTYEYNTAL